MITGASGSPILSKYFTLSELESSDELSLSCSASSKTGLAPASFNNRTISGLSSLSIIQSRGSKSWRRRCGGVYLPPNPDHRLSVVDGAGMRLDVPTSSPAIRRRASDRAAGPLSRTASAAYADRLAQVYSLRDVDSAVFDHLYTHDVIYCCGLPVSGK